MSASQAAISAEPPRLAAGLRPLIERVARARTSVHTKLRVGFLALVLLLVAMAILSVAIIANMASQAAQLSVLFERVDLSRQLMYDITSQSHYRAMALLTHDDAENQAVAAAKTDFLQRLDQLEQIGSPEDKALFARLDETNARYATAGQQVLDLYNAGQTGPAMQLHLSLEHPISHELEGTISTIIGHAEQDSAAAQVTFDASRRLLTIILAAFCCLSLLLGLVLGYVLSWSFVLPVRRINAALAQIAGGQFGQHVSVPNRDEFGTLSTNVNAMSEELASLYGELQTLNAQLQGTNTQLLGQLQAQVEELSRSGALITEAEERLRRELAEVLHSRVQNRLLMVWYRLEELQDVLQEQPSTAQEIAAIREQIDEIREQDVRQLSHRLHPSIIRAGLLEALEVLAEEMPRLDIHIHADDRVRDVDDPATNGIPEVVRLTAYRVVEEALGNVVKHAQASQVEIDLQDTPAGLALEVRDDGRGIDPHAVRSGLGLSSISARVGRVGGQWTIRARSDGVRGTCLRAVLPYSVEQLQNSLGAQAALGQEDRADAHGGRAVAGAAGGAGQDDAAGGRERA